MKIKDIDNITITVSNIEKSQRFYHEVFDMPEIFSDDGRPTLLCGKQAIKLQEADNPFELSGHNQATGVATLCIIVKESLESVMNHFESYYVDIVTGPVKSRGAHGELNSIYIHDPDLNLIEVSVYA